jgi:hypothetical protein
VDLVGWYGEMVYTRQYCMPTQMAWGTLLYTKKLNISKQSMLEIIRLVVQTYHKRTKVNTFCVHSPVKTFIWAPTRLSFDLRAHIPRTEFFVTCSKTAMRSSKLNKKWYNKTILRKQNNKIKIVKLIRITNTDHCY